ncbi:MAG: hypothetical protein ABIP29_06070 [Candidatus Eisenbacteria bacterium]
MRSLPLYLLALVPLAAAVPAVAKEGAKAPVTCTGAIQHPIEARVTALDPIRRGAVVRFEVTTTSRHDLKGVEARVVRNRGVEIVGPERAALVRRNTSGGEEGTAQFRVVVPRTGHRAVVQFVVQGEGPSGLLTRGVTYNLLPDGPAETLRAATTGSGEGLLEAPARRIDR